MNISTRFLNGVGAAVAILCLAGAAQAETTFAKLEVFPPTIDLNTSRDRQSFVAVATRADGVTVDVTGQLAVKIADEKLVQRAGNVLRPAADGKTTIEFSLGSHKVEVPVQVREAAKDRPISFVLDVMPVFMRSGCNTGSCHGAARGKDGFMLSLFGYDPGGDHFRLTRELGFRRINLARPEESLLQEKSIGAVPHTGGKRFEKDSEYYDAIHRWLLAGAPNDTGNVPKVVRVEVYPQQIVLQGEGAKQQLTARAVYTDGTDRDITNLVVFQSNNDNSAPVTADGLVSAANRGEAFIMARFDTHTVGMQVLTLPANVPYVKPTEKPANFIDVLVNNKLEKLRIEPSAICNDEAFLRRASLDLIGLLPSEQEFYEFANDKDPNKRAKLVDRLLNRREFAEIWAQKWADILLVRSVNNLVDRKTVYKYFHWLTDEIDRDVPLSEIAKQLITANGSTFDNPAASYYQTQRSAQILAENTAQVFMGMRIQCAQCHNHPFDRWTMDDYYSFTAFFAQVGRKQAEDTRDAIIFNRGGGDVRHPVNGQVMAPKYLGGAVPDAQGKDRRDVLAAWLASPENPYFAQNVANRVWEHFFGIGIVDPVDDVRVSNPPTNPQLLDALAKKFTDDKYDLRKLVRDICLSNAYQRSTQRNPSNAEDELNFAHGRIRRIKAESLLDCICQVTEAPEKHPGLPLGARAVEIADGAAGSYFLTTFGRSQRLTVCAADATTDPTLSQSLHLLNGPTVHGKVERGAVVKRLLDAKKTPDQVIETLYVRCLGRKPTSEELIALHKALEAEKNQQKALEDVFWAILNSREFVFNH